jgi:hypothetical protein
LSSSVLNTIEIRKMNESNSDEAADFENMQNESRSEESTGNRLRKRKPLIVKQLAKRPLISKTQRTAAQRVAKMSKSSRIKYLENSIKKILSIICDLPSNISMVLDWSAEELSQILESLEEMKDNHANIYMSDIGRATYALSRIISETYPNEKKTPEIMSTCRAILIQAVKMFSGQVSECLLKFFDCSSLKEEIESVSRQNPQQEQQLQKQNIVVPESKSNGIPAQIPTPVEVTRL